jgi:hypothetical protein
LPDLGLRLCGCIRLDVLTAKPCLWYIQVGPKLRGRVRAVDGA